MVVKPESAIGAKGAIQTMKQTVDTLKAAGWTGYTKGKITGNVFPARHVLDSMAWILNNQNKENCQWTIRTTYDDLGKKVRVHFICRAWIPEKPYEEFAERNMTEAEIAEAEKRLAEMGVTVVRRA